MGSRGADVKTIDDYRALDEKDRTSKFTSLLQIGNIKFLVQNDESSTKTAEFSNTPKRIYVVLKKDGKFKEIIFHGRKGEYRYSIHERHSINNKYPEIHGHPNVNERIHHSPNQIPKRFLNAYKWAKHIINSYNLSDKAKKFERKKYV